MLARDGRVLSTGYSGAPSGVPHCTPETCSPSNPCLRTIHAEANTVAFAARNGIATEGSDLYVTTSPCRDCAKLIINAGIRVVIYADEYRDTSPLDLLRQVGVSVVKFSQMVPREGLID